MNIILCTRLVAFISNGQNDIDKNITHSKNSSTNHSFSLFIALFF